MLNAAKEMKAAGLAYEFESVSQFTGMIVPGTSMVVAQFNEQHGNRVFMGYYGPEDAQKVAQALVKRRSIVTVRIVTATAVEA